MSDTLRTFIAIELPEKIVSAISKVQEGIRSYGFKIRWVRPENIHLTLKFLGNIKEDDTKKVGNTIFESVKGYKPISLKADKKALPNVEAVITFLTDCIKSASVVNSP